MDMVADHLVHSPNVSSFSQIPLDDFLADQQVLNDYPELQVSEPDTDISDGSSYMTELNATSEHLILTTILPRKLLK